MAKQRNSLVPGPPYNFHLVGWASDPARELGASLDPSVQKSAANRRKPRNLKGQDIFARLHVPNPLIQVPQLNTDVPVKESKRARRNRPIKSDPFDKRNRQAK